MFSIHNYIHMSQVTLSTPVTVSADTKERYKNDNVSQEFLEAAEVYRQQCTIVNTLQRQLQKEQKEKKQYYETLVSKCTHNYEAQPREYQSPREWICSICGDYI